MFSSYILVSSYKIERETKEANVKPSQPVALEMGLILKE